MRRRLLYAVFVIVALLAGSMLTFAGGGSATAPPAPPGGFVDSIRFFPQANQAQALLDLKSGAMDVYTDYLRSSYTIDAAHADPDLRTADTYGFEENLFVNPVPVDQVQAPGVFNPFSIRDVREALNYLIDRNYLNSALFGGRGASHAAVWNDASPEVVRDPFFFRDLNRGASYDFNRARTIIFTALNAAGATYDGTWKWHGNPIVVPILIRLEDTRHQLGDYVADQVQRLGFTVNRQYVGAGAAFGIVYFGPPETGAWMLYTEAFFTNLQVSRWPDSDLDLYHCGSDGSAVFSFYSAPLDLQDACSRLASGRYSTEAERRQLIERGVSTALHESVRVWLVASTVNVYSARVTAVVSDSAGGFYGPLSLRTARFATPGGTLSIGQRAQFVSPFQPWQGFAYTGDAVIGQTVMDVGLTTHPRTGTYIPVRSEFETTTAGPTGTMAVPANALTWDPTTMGFTNVPAGTTSKSKVRFHYTFGTWHDGASMTMADVLYQIALIARRDRGDISSHDADALNLHDRMFGSLFRGLTVVNPTTLDLYLDYWHLDPSFIASAADVWPPTPWEVGELAMATTLHDHTRVSPLSAIFGRLPPLDLTKGPTIGYMDREIAAGNITPTGPTVSRPPGLQSFITATEAQGRWTALQSWRTARNHYFVSNGPYVLDSVDVGTRQATVTKFGAYPFPQDRWDRFLNPPVPDVRIEVIDRVVSGEQSTVTTFTTFNGQPFSAATVRYRIQPIESSATLASGIAARAAPGEWQVNLNPDLTRTLTPGTYRFEVAANGNDSSIVAFAEGTFTVTSHG
jgi:peptide/nickel transport system substrate-binding protein